VEIFRLRNGIQMIIGWGKKKKGRRGEKGKFEGRPAASILFRLSEEKKKKKEKKGKKEEKKAEPSRLLSTIAPGTCTGKGKKKREKGGEEELVPDGSAVWSRQCKKKKGGKRGGNQA